MLQPDIFKQNNEYLPSHHGYSNLSFEELAPFRKQLKELEMKKKRNQKCEGFRPPDEEGTERKTEESSEAKQKCLWDT